MKAAYFMGHETFEVRECPIPKAKPGTVVVKNYACGVCGTDVHIYHGEKGSAAVNPPVVLGHEYSGVVTEVGEGVKGLKIGDHVTIDPNIYCGECEYCRNGKKQMCRHMEAVGVTMNGGFEEYSIVPAAQALLLDPNVPLECGAMSEPLACCLHGIDRAEINKNVSTTLHITGDARVVLELLLSRVAQKANGQWMQQARSMMEEYLSDELFEPRKILRQMAAIAPEITVATDVGQHQMWTAQHFPFLHPRQLITSGGLGTMGFGLGAAMGAAASDPAGRPVALVTGDAQALARAPGIGKKTAQRLVLELKDKVTDEELTSSGPSVSVRPAADSAETEAIEALMALGYPASDAAKAVSAVAGQAAKTDEILRLALRGMTGGR